MMCEHEYKPYMNSNHSGFRLVCVKCFKTKQEIDIEEKLAAANARAEQAEAQCAKYHVALLKIKTWCGEPMHYDGVELQYVLNIAKAALEGKP